MNKPKFLQSRYEKALNAFTLLINKHIRNASNDLLDYLPKLSGDIEQGNFRYARGSTVYIDGIISLHRAGIQSLINVRVKRIFEENHPFPVTFEDIQTKTGSVYRWLDEVTELTRELRRKLDSTDKVEIMAAKKSLQDKICFDNNLSDLADTLTTLAMEFILYLEKRPQDELLYLFDKMNFHPLVTKSSRRLFKDGYYAEAILEASKALIIFIRQN